MPNDSSTQPSSPASDPEIDRLRDRLSFYESFDQLIQSNVSQAGSLLREAVDLRENAAADADNAKHQIEEERTKNRERYRALFSVMLDEITSLQGQAERLARRLTDAIDQLESELSPGTEFPPLPSNLTADFNEKDEIRDAVNQSPGEEEPADRLNDSLAAQPCVPAAIGTGSTIAAVTVDEVAQEPHPAGQPTPSIDDSTLVEPANQSELASADEDVHHSDSPPKPQDALTVDKTGLDDSSEPVPGIDDTIIDSPEEPVTIATSDLNYDSHESALAKAPAEYQFILLVHGVPRAATALSLKRHLETLEHVQTVEPREFAAGVLRLVFRVSRDVTAGDMNEWPENSGFTVIHARPGLLEIQLDR